MNYNKTTILSVKNLTVTYNKYGSIVKALDNLSLEPLQQGSWTFLVGNNGSGKSTLFKAITKGFENYSGSIELDGINIKKIPFKQLSKLVFLINQNPLACTVDELTVLENLQFATNNKTKEELEESLRQSGLVEHQNHLAKNLSGGQRQLLALQIARLRKVKLLLLDEPFASLDPENIAKGLNLITLLQKEGATIFFITHEINLINNFTSGFTNIYKLDKGHIIF